MNDSLDEFVTFNDLELSNESLDLEIDLEKNNISLFLEKNCDEIRKQFYELETPKDVANLLNVPYKRLVYHLYKVSSSQKYIAFEIPKKSSGSRIIHAPATALKIIQRKLSQVLYCVYKTKPSVYGFAPNRNVVKNAQIHVKKRYVLNIDLKDFFSSINFGRVRGMFMGKPYNLNPTVATVLAQICCHENKLPQGAPSSPIVTNMICGKMDSQLQQLSKNHKCTYYTRYADDITFSTTLREFPTDIACKTKESGEDKLALGQDLISIITGNGFEINDRKVRFQTKNSRQEVTGLTVNKFPNVSRSYIRNIRAILHYWQTFGLDSAEAMYRKKNDTKSRRLGKPIPLKQILRGKIEFIGAVRGKESPIYIKYMEQYYSLLRAESNRTNQLTLPL